MAYGNILADVVQSSVTGTAPVFKDGNSTEVGTLCRAWVNFNGSSGTVVVRGSFNVQSVTRNATADYTITFTNLMPDANYVVNLTVEEATSDSAGYNNTMLIKKSTTNTTSSFRIMSIYNNYGLWDPVYAMVSVFR